MWELTTTSGLIGNLSWLQSKKLEYQALIAKLELELQNSELTKRINQWKELLKELNLEEIELKNNGIKILEKAWINKFSANGIEIRLKVSAWKLIIDSEKDIDNCYKTEKTTVTTSIDKNAIKADMKEWVIVEWVTLQQDKTLEIKYL